MKSFSFVPMMSYMFSLFLIMGCSAEKRDHQRQIDDLEGTLYDESTGRFNMSSAQELIASYLNYAEMYPDDSLAPEYLFKAGDMCMNLGKPQKAIETFDRILASYPGYEKTPQSLFLKGYVLENHLNDLENARRIYEEFLERFPDDDFADDAEACIRNLGKSPEELIREFETQHTDSLVP
ncbi:MAG: tetratricopeptide repeat protein [Bacteroidales bacterium]|nr:tetratricopeptide repeat protein [Bacteroidales bacterium]